MEIFWLSVIFFAAAFTQGLTGFGVMLVAMPFLVLMFDFQFAAPLGAALSLGVIVPLLIRYRRSIDFRPVWRLSVAGLVGIPLGVASITYINGDLLKLALGLVIILYSLYSLLEWRLPELSDPNLAFGFGFLGGVLGGAFNTTGPPVIVFGDVRRWAPQVFRANLQAFFLVSAVFILINHALNGNLTGPVLQSVVLTAPAVVLGQWTGARVSDRLSPSVFRKLVLFLLIVVGLRLII